MSLSVLGMDISSYQPVLDVRQIDPAVKIAVLKDSQGYLQDPDLIINGRILANAGKTLAAYVWPDPGLPPSANIGPAAVGIDKAGLPLTAVFLDTEQYKSDAGKLLSPDAISEHARQTYLLAKQAWGRVGVYTNRMFIMSWAPQMALWLSEYQVPLWLAEYKLEPSTHTLLDWPSLLKLWLPNYSPDLPLECVPAQVVGHQFSGDRFCLPGVYANAQLVRSPLDINMFDPAFFVGSLTSSPTPDAAPAQITSTWECVVPLLYIRSGPSANYSIIGTMKQGDTKQVALIENGWCHFVGDGWSFSGYMKKVIGPVMS